MMPDDTKAMVDMSNDTVYNLVVDVNNSFLRNGFARLPVLYKVRPCEWEIYSMV